MFKGAKSWRARSMEPKQGLMCASKKGHFPLKGCYEDDTDLLWLMDNDNEKSRLQHFLLIIQLKHDLILQAPSGNNSKWMVAIVVDQLSAHNETTNVSHWSFYRSDENWKRYTIPKTNILEVPIRDVRSRLEYKIQIIQRLFVEMRGVRNNSVHVGVVFFNGKSLTQKEIISVPSIVQQLSSKVKIFTVIYGSKLVEEVVHLTDTLVLPDMDISYFIKYLLMAMCETCGPGWVLFKHTTGLSMLSCFRIFPIFRETKWLDALHYCKSPLNGNLAGIETEEEMLFLKEQLLKIFTDLNLSNISFHIGLTRDLGNYAKRFQWMTSTGKFRPLLIPHWLPGQPCRDCKDDDCVVWQFTNTTSDKDNRSVSEGWININCYSEINSEPLCEIALPRNINDVDFIFSTPVPKEHINFTIPKEHFLIYERNIISMTANVPNSNFLQFLRKSNIDFPVFDCGEDSGDRRYISYNLVCDFVDHCSNRLDELLCLKFISPNDLNCISGQRLYHKEYQCDKIKDCRDDSDEKFCIHRNCEGGQCQNGSCLPLQWDNNVQDDCFIYTISFQEYINSYLSLHKSKPPINKKRCALVCDPDICVNKSQRNDSVKDCRGTEGLIAKTLGKLESADSCKNSFGHYIWAPKCHYIKDRYGGIVGCTDMSHLRDCENFQCGQGYGKCYNSYCIPHYYLRDGRADCPTGEDEQLFYTGPCTGHFACWDSNICLHPDLVCDGYTDCPYDDDELGCRDDCLKGFRCIAGTVSVTDYNRSIPLDMTHVYAMDRQMRYLDLTGVEFQEMNSFLHTAAGAFLNLKVLILSKCNISELFLPLFSNNPPFVIQKLDISYNKFEAFATDEYNYFYKHINYLNISHNRPLKLLRNLRFNFLEIIDLSFTSLSYLNDSVFAQLPRLKHLNLSHSLISKFTSQFFRSKLTLQTLDLRGILTQDLDDYFFHDLTISQALYSDLFQICCPQIRGLVITQRTCVAPVHVDAISSCANLLGIDIQRFLLWIVAILSVLGNVTIIVYRVIWDRSVLQTGYGLFVTNLGISDFIMGVYLLMIAGADSFYRDSYVLYDKTWRNSVVCKIASFMACLSCEASTFFVFLITLDRFLVMKFPFGQIKFTWFHKTIAVVMSWLVSFLLSLIPIVLKFDIYSSNAMCLALPLKNTYARGWEYSVAVFIICNLIMFVFVACGQYAIFRAMSKNRISKTATNIPSSRRAEDITVAKQLSLVVLSNFLFWFPVGIMGLMSLGGHEVSSQVYAWTTVLLLPINSAANPVLYTIPALLERWQQFKRGG
ncbi:unnamed protein product [Candidula unifasciata]|uniref:Uncharacterized protein n=1 Tax=Candidula unifasciata TaxID=100452 RepID=A0A8S3YIG5_9EUPU|nr:unnamed protein product [Candidula unifasciata]